MNVIIIGATQGLGLELTKKFLKEGHAVAAGVVDRATPKALEELLGQYGRKLMVFQADVTNEDEILRGAGLCMDFFDGKADALCNVAGVLLPSDRVKTIDKCDIPALRKTIEVNTIGVVIVAKSFYPIIKRGGRLFTVTSESVGTRAIGTWVPCYALSKAPATKACGIFNLSVQDVDFFAVHPGRMNTEMGKTTAQIEPQESAEGFYKLMMGETPVSRDEWYINYKGERME